MYLLVLFLPSVSAFITGFFGKFLGKQGVKYINISCMFGTFVVSCLIFYEVVFLKYTCSITLWEWFSLGNVFVNFDFLFDSITATMLFAISLVSLLVHLYSWDYMGDDPHFIRFMSYLSFFTFCMFVLVTAGNLVQFFAGWEGVGLASYLLINFWYTRTQANTAALKAMVINRFGDFGLYVGLVLLFALIKTTNFQLIFATIGQINNYYYDFSLILPFGLWTLPCRISLISIICFFLFLGAVGKSAQVGLHVWLPDAMEGPTPVSALIHAATMVTAGVFLIIRMSPVFERSQGTLIIISIVGALTAFFAASIGLVQNDLKKIIAYSTCSQLGYMVFACGSSNYLAGFYHLINHAFFKALLFLCAGCVIHALLNEQDIRRMGGLAKIVPITYVMMLIGSLSLLGFPFLTGFYSKDIILELAFSSYTWNSMFAYLLGLISVSFTAFYSCRLLHLTFFGESNALKHVIVHAHEAPKYMLSALIPLAFGSIFWGYVSKDLFMGFGSDVWQTSIHTSPSHYVGIEAEFLPLIVKLLPLFLCILAVGLSFRQYVLGAFFIGFWTNKWVNNFRYVALHSFLTKKWYFDLIYIKFIATLFWSWSYRYTFKFFDRGILEILGPLGVVRVTRYWAYFLIKLHTGLIAQYVFYNTMLVAIFFFATFSVEILSTSFFCTVVNPHFLIDHKMDIFIFIFLFITYSLVFTAVLKNSRK